MDELKFVRVENSKLIVSDDAGELHRVPVDDMLVSAIRQIARSGHQSKASPKEIQSLIRAGKSASEVASITGADLDDVERFEAPVVAEREFVLENALRVTLVLNPADSHANFSSFGAVIQDHLDELHAADIAWTAWKDEALGWIISLAFTSRDVAHHALWLFDHKKNVLTPHNNDATSLSKQGTVGDRLIPKLRAVDVANSADRFDSGAFASIDASPTLSPVEDTHREEIVPDNDAFEEPLEEFERRQIIEERAVSREDASVDYGQTADLLDALRKRRGERDSQPQPTIAVTDPPVAPEFDTDVIPAGRLNPTQPLDEGYPQPAAVEDVQGQDEASPNDSGKVGAKRGRQGMPSWDDILFGTKSDEDPF